jgi:hypothetical protein
MPTGVISMTQAESCRPAGTRDLRPLALYTTPLDRGSPVGVTWLSTANEARAIACHTCSLVSLGQQRCRVHQQF